MPGSSRASKTRASALVALFLCLQLLAVIAVNPASANRAAGQLVQVTRVIDGDTVILRDGRHIRLIGINTPEIGKKGRPDQPLAWQAQRQLQALVNNATTMLTPGQAQQDRHGRTLAYLDVIEDAHKVIDVQDQLIKAGLAWLVAIPPNINRLKLYIDSQAQAKQQKRGIWAHRQYRPKAVSTLGTGSTGFQQVRGRVKSIGSSRKYLYLNLGPQFSVRISHENWKTYFQGSPETLVNKQVIVRGWISKQGKASLGMRVAHPAMIEIDSTQ